MLHSFWLGGVFEVSGELKCADGETQLSRLNIQRLIRYAMLDELYENRVATESVFKNFYRCVTRPRSLSFHRQRMHYITRATELRVRSDPRSPQIAYRTEQVSILSSKVQ